MSRSKIISKPKSRRLKALPWAGLLQVGVAVGRRWRSLSEKERASLARLVRESGGRPARLGKKERKELGKLVGKLDLKGLRRELLPLARGRRGRARRTRRILP